MVVKLLSAAVLALTLTASALAQSGPDQHPTSVGSLRLESAWVRATPPAARTGAAYLAIANTGAEPDRLTGARSPAAAQVELHTHQMEGGIARMRGVDAVDIPAGGRVAFSPGGLHLMLVDLKEPLRENTRISLTLRFARAGEMTIEVPVTRNAPAAAPAASHRH